MYTASVGQSIHSQSSGEAEFYSAVSGVSAGLGVQYLLHFMGMMTTVEVQLDSSAARGVLWRSGVGRIRHLEVKTLWVQDLVVAKRITIKPVPGLQNVADIGTKVLSADRIKYLKEKIGSRGIDELGKTRVAAARMTRATRAVAPSVVQQIAALLALLPLTIGRSSFDEGAGCQLQVAPAVIDHTDRGGVAIVLLLIIVAWLVGMIVGAGLMYLSQERPAPRLEVKVVGTQCLADQKHQLSQAQTTYTFKNSTPRFKLLPESAHG